MIMKRSEIMYLTFLLVVLAKFCECSLDLVNHQGLINQLGITIPKQDEVDSTVSFVEGTTAQLPCNITAEDGDFVKLVLWFKGEGNKPIYTYDKRSGSGEGRHYSNDTVFKGRAYYRGEEKVSRLVIENISKDDKGEYRCRADFHTAPTRKYVVVLDIIEPPEKPYIIDQAVNKIITNKLGPYREGDDIELRCEVLGGNPAPEVTWWKDHVLLKSNQQFLNHKVINKLKIKDVSRSDLHSLFTCQASNNNQTVPISTSIKLDLTYGPENVVIEGLKPTLSAGVQYRVSCISQGSRPAPSIHWYRGNMNLDSMVYNNTTSTDGATTTSTILYTPLPQHTGSMLRCVSGLESLPGSTVETAYSLKVHYKPKLSINYGRSLDPNNIKENEDVYFECHVEASPPPFKISWRKNGEVIKQDLEEGVIVSNQTLVLQKVRRAESAVYTCEAQNQEGVGESQPIDLVVRFKPVCALNQQKVYGVGKHETVSVKCQVEADPAQKLKFRWWFNTTRERLDIQESQVQTDGNTSILKYTPRTELDYGTLYCAAENDVGTQNEACNYHLVAAGPPESLYNCSLSNQSSSGVQVHCQPGFNGGIRETEYELVVADEIKKTIIKNESSHSPVFSVSGLEARTTYNLNLYAINRQGRSKNITLTFMTSEPPSIQPAVQTSDHARLGSLKTKFTVTPILGVLIGVGAALMLVTLTIISILCCRNNYEKIVQGLPKDKDASSPDVIPRGEDGYKQIDHYSTLPTAQKSKRGGLQQEEDMQVLSHIHNNISRLQNTELAEQYTMLLPAAPSCQIIQATCPSPLFPGGGRHGPYSTLPLSCTTESLLSPSSYSGHTSSSGQPSSGSSSAGFSRDTGSPNRDRCLLIDPNHVSRYSPSSSGGCTSDQCSVETALISNEGSSNQFPRLDRESAV